MPIPTISNLRRAPSGPILTDLEVMGANVIRSLEDLPATRGGGGADQNFRDLEPGIYIFANDEDIVMGDGEGLALVDTAGTGGSHTLIGWGSGALTGAPNSGANPSSFLIFRIAGQARNVLLQNLNLAVTDTGSSVEVTGPADDPFVISNCRFRTSAVGTGVTVNSGSFVQIDSCHFHAQNFGVSCDGGMLLSNSVFEDTGGHHVELTSSADFVNVANCYFRGATDSVSIDGSEDRTAFTGCQWRNVTRAIFSSNATANGSLQVVGCMFNGMTTGVEVTDLPAEGLFVIGCAFDSIGNALVGATAGSANTFVRASVENLAKMSETAITP